MTIKGMLLWDSDQNITKMPRISRSRSRENSGYYKKSSLSNRKYSQRSSRSKSVQKNRSVYKPFKFFGKRLMEG